MDPVTVLQLALKDLGGQAALAGLLGGLLFAGLSLLQLPAVFWLDPRFSDPRRCARLHLPALACTAGLAVAFRLGLAPALLLKVYLALATGFFLLLGPVIPYWIAMISRGVPEGVRGRYFAWCFSLANLGGIASGAWAVRWIGAGGLPWGYSRCFSAALLLQLASISLLLLLRPLEPAAPAPSMGLSAWLRRELVPLLRQRPLQLFLLVTVFMQVASAPFNLYTDFLKQRGLSTGWWAWLNAAKNVGGVAGAFLMGYLADHRGPRYSLGLAFALMASSLLLLPLAGRGPSMGAFFGGGFFSVAYPVINLYMLMRLAAPGQTAVLSAAFATVSAPLILGAPALSGWLAEQAGFGASFALSIAACLGGALYLLRHPDLGARGAVA